MSSSHRNSRLGVDLDNALTSSASSAVNSETATITAIDAMGASRGGEDHEDTPEQRVGLLDSETGIGEYGSIASSSESYSCSVGCWFAGNLDDSRPKSI